MGGSLAVFGEGRGAMEEGRSRTVLGSCGRAFGFATVTMADTSSEFEISQRSPKEGGAVF